MMLVPNVRRGQPLLIRHFERKLAYFQRIPAHRREAECADEGEATCRAMLAELGVPGHAKPKEPSDSRVDLMTLDEFFRSDWNR